MEVELKEITRQHDKILKAAHEKQAELERKATAVRLGNFLFWLCIIIAGAWLWLAHSIGADQDMPAVVFGGAGIALAVGWALRHITRRGLG
jgi:hypothetical protein